MTYRVNKKSAGIICWKFDGRYKVLIERKRCTYAFVEFARGHYDSANDKRLKYLFNRMTVNEKIDIMSLSFPNIWRRVWLHDPEHVYTYTLTRDYLRKAHKFNSCFLNDGGIRLYDLIKNTQNIESNWEFPKGRKNSKSELDVECAIRETYEETGLKKKYYKILFNVAPINTSHSDRCVNYISTYYTAIIKNNKKGGMEPRIIFNCKNQLSEVDAIKWATLEEVKMLMPNLYNIAKKSLSGVKKNKSSFIN